MRAKMISLLLALAMLLALGACSPSDVREYEPEAGEEIVDKYVRAYEKYAPDTLVMTIDGTPVYWKEYYYWLYSSISQLEYYYGEITDWDGLLGIDDTTTYGSYVLDLTMSPLKYFDVGAAKAEDMGITLREEDRAELETAWTENVKAYGTLDEDIDTSALSEEEIFALQEESFYAYMSDIFLDRELYGKINEISLLYYNIFSEMFGEAGEKLDGGEVVSYAQENGYMAAKHILFMTVDSATMEALPEDEVMEKKQKAEETLAALLETPAQELEAKFDELMFGLSEDTGLMGYPNGYCFGASVMDPGFEEGTRALEPGQVSAELIESTYGYHIILRIPLTADMTGMSAAGETRLSELLATERFNSLADSWMAAADVVVEPEFENVSIARLLGE